VAYGLLVLRAVIGLIFFAHGSQKLFGWFGGGGRNGTAGWLESMNFRPAKVLALVVGLSEASGLLFALGFLTPLAALLLSSTMVVAIAAVHRKNGFFNGAGGYEFNLTLIAVVVAVAATGPGRFSIDRAIGWDGSTSGLWWGVGVVVLALLGGGFVLTALRSPALRSRHAAAA
jgi:putative oxidoreductase